MQTGECLTIAKTDSSAYAPQTPGDPSAAAEEAVAGLAVAPVLNRGCCCLQRGARTAEEANEIFVDEALGAEEADPAGKERAARSAPAVNRSLTPAERHVAKNTHQRLLSVMEGSSPCIKRQMLRNKGAGAHHTSVPTELASDTGSRCGTHTSRASPFSASCSIG